MTKPGTLTDAARVTSDIDIEVDLDDQRPGEGFIYILLFSSGTIKVGQTIDPRQRLTTHRRDAAAYNVTLVRNWFSPPHVNYLTNEEALIEMCRPHGIRVKREYFQGIRPDLVLDLAASLDYESAPAISCEVGR
jgi:hypothetical protein